MRQQQPEPRAAGVLDHVGEKRRAKSAPLQVGADDESDFRRARLHPGDGGEPEEPAAHVERADCLDPSVIEPEQSAKGVAIAERSQPAESPSDILGMQETSELDATWQIGRIEPSQAPPKLVIEGSGRGHGVGLCQWGAKFFAASGAPAAEILAFYFPGTTVTSG